MGCWRIDNWQSLALRTWCYYTQINSFWYIFLWGMNMAISRASISRGHTKVAFSWDAVIHKQQISRAEGDVMDFVVFARPSRHFFPVFSVSWRSVLKYSICFRRICSLSSGFLMTEKSIHLADHSGCELLPLQKLWKAFFAMWIVQMQLATGSVLLLCSNHWGDHYICAFPNTVLLL